MRNLVAPAAPTVSGACGLPAAAGPAGCWWVRCSSPPQVAGVAPATGPTGGKLAGWMLSWGVGRHGDSAGSARLPSCFASPWLARASSAGPCSPALGATAARSSGGAGVVVSCSHGRAACRSRACPLSGESWFSIALRSLLRVSSLVGRWARPFVVCALLASGVCSLSASVAAPWRSRMACAMSRSATPCGCSAKPSRWPCAFSVRFVGFVNNGRLCRS